MTTFLRGTTMMVVLLSLGACVAPRVPPADTGRVPASQAPPPQTAPAPPMNPAPSSTGFIPPQIMRGAGLERVIGADATALANLFGTPALDVIEGDARKLQFRGSGCVLDVYLYPLRPRAQPTATWIEARRPDNSRDVDRAECVAALRR